MNLKKLFATSAVFALTVSLFAPAITSANVSYGAEVTGAYEYAHSKNVTTLPSVEVSNPYGKAIRSHVAKMMSNWALNVMDVKPDTSITPHFTDIANVSNEMKGYIIKAVQQKLMGQGGDKFMPQENVSRAQFGTVLSRALYGDKYNGGTPYYKNHLEALKAAGIMNNLSNPERPVQRYEIWLMLKRADATSKLNEEDTKDLSYEQLMKCLSDMSNFDKCVADAKADAKKEEEKKEDVDKVDVKKSGDLKVSIDNSNSVISVPNVGVITFGEVKFEANKDIDIKGVDLERGGLGNYRDVKAVWFEKDGVRVSTKGYVSSDDTASLSFNPTLTVKSDDTFDLVAELSGSVGNEHFLEITKVDSTAKDVDLDAKTSTVRTTNYTVANLEFQAMTGTMVSYKLGDSATFELGKFKLRNESTDGEKDVKVKSIVLRQKGNGDLENLSDITVYRNGEDVKAKASTDGKYLTLVLDNTIESGRTALYTINAKVDLVDDENGDTYKFDLKKDADLVAIEKSTKFRTTLSGKNILREYKVRGGNIILAKADLDQNVDASAGDDDVVLLKGTITPKEAIMLEDITLPVTFGTPLAYTGISKFRLKIGRTSIVGKWNLAHTSMIFEGQYNIERKTEVALTVDLKDLAPEGGTIKITNGLRLQDFVEGEYQSTQNDIDLATDGVGQIASRKITIQSDTLTVTKTDDNTEVTIVKSDSNERTIYEGKVYTNNDKGLTIDEAKVELGSKFANGKAAATFYIGGDIQGPYATDSNGDVKFNALGFKLDKDAKKVVKVSVNVYDNAIPAGTTSAKLYLDGTNYQGNAIDKKTVKLASVKMVDKGTATLATTNVEKNKALAEGSVNNEIASFDVTVKNEDLDLDKVVMSLSGTNTGLDLINSAVIEYKDADGKVVVAGDAELSGTELKLDNVSGKTLKPGTYTFIVKSNFGTLLDGYTGHNIEVNTGKVWFRSTAGTVTGEKAGLGFADYVARAVPTVAKTSFAGDTTNLMKLNVVNPKGDHAIKVKGFDIALDTFVGSGLKATVNGTTYDLTKNGTVYTFAAGEEVNIVANKSVEVTLVAGAGTSVANDTTATITVNAINYVVTEDGSDYEYTLNDNNAGNIANWAGLYNKIKG